MKKYRVVSQTEGTFFRCLHDEIPENTEVTSIRKAWHREYLEKGLRAKVLIDDNNQVIGMAQYLPVEHSPFKGHNLMAILCLWVHGYNHHVGNQQKKGYGRLLIEYIENDARESGMDGVVTWGKDFPFWNPVAFFEHMGYQRVDEMGINILVWKPFAENAAAPSIKRRQHEFKENREKVVLTTFQCCWCNGGIEYCQTAEKAAQALPEIVEHQNFIENQPNICDNIYIDSTAYRPDGPPFTAAELKEELKQCHKKKTT